MSLARVDLARAGDPDALDALMREHRTQVIRYAMRLCVSPADAEDATQEALLALSRHIGALREVAALSSWLFAAVRTHCTRLARRSLRYALTLDDDRGAPPALEGPSPEDQLVDRQLRHRLALILADLDPALREVIVRRDILDEPARDAAEGLGLTVEALKSRLHRARQEVRRQLLASIDRTSSSKKKKAPSRSISEILRSPWRLLRAEVLMKIYGHPLSSCTRKVLMTLAEKEQKADITPVDLFVAEHKASHHLARHPFGVVPVLDDDGFVLYESRAILRYLDRKFSNAPLTPNAAKDVARMDQWLSVDQSYVAPHTRTLAVERILKKHEGRAADPAAERAAEGALASAFAVLDGALRESPYLAGAALSLADISLMPYVASLPMIGAEHLLADFPRLAAWRGRVEQRPSWKQAIAAD